MVKLALLSLISVVCATPFKRMIVHEQVHTTPNGFVNSGQPASDHMLTLRIALVSNDLATLEKSLYDVSTPGNALYGQHLSKSQVEALVAPSSETVSALNTWLTSNNLVATPISPAGDWVSITLSVSQANSILSADFTTFTHSETQQQAIRTLSYSIPAELAGHIELIHPTVNFPTSFGLKPTFAAPHTRSLESRQVPASCSRTVTPACLQALYGIPATRATQASNKLAVSGFIEQFANQADLRTFLTNLRPDIPSNTTFTLQTIDGGTNSQSAAQAGVEANLDIQYTIGVATGVPTTFISVGEQFQDGDLSGFLDIINFLNGMSAPPQILTTSYGADESDISQALAVNLCNAYMQLGARGVSILFASGDGGVAGSRSQTCTTFVPTFPSGCPFMTSVGATQGTTETTASFSSGGFSNFFARPAYQNTAVSSYLTKLGSTNSGRFNTSGRAFPDISAQGNNVEIIVGGSAGLVGGTSCSSPIFASVISLLNDRLIAAGKPVLGFLNPFLYSTGASALNDITTGSNPGCGTNGFPALAGWDPATGLGTPNFAKLLTAVGL